MKQRLLKFVLAVVVSVSLIQCISFSAVNDEDWAEIKKYYYLSQTITNDPWIHYNLAMVYAYTGFVEEGFHSLARITEIDEKFAEKALKKYRRKIYRDPTNWKHRFYYAFALYFNQQKDEAIEALEAVVELANTNSIKGWSYGYIAVIYGEKNDWDNAMKAINDAIIYEPSGAALYFALGLARKELGDNIGAASAILKASALQAKQLLSKKSIRRLKNEK